MGERFWFDDLVEQMACRGDVPTEVRPALRLLGELHSDTRVGKARIGNQRAVNRGAGSLGPSNPRRNEWLRSWASMADWIAEDTKAWIAEDTNELSLIIHYAGKTWPLTEEQAFDLADGFANATLEAEPRDYRTRLTRRTTAIFRILNKIYPLPEASS